MGEGRCRFTQRALLSSSTPFGPAAPPVYAALKAMLIIYYGPFVCHSGLDMIFFSCSSFDTIATMALIPSTVNEQVWGAGS